MPVGFQGPVRRFFAASEATRPAQAAAGPKHIKKKERAPWETRSFWFGNGIQLGTSCAPTLT